MKFSGVLTMVSARPAFAGRYALIGGSYGPPLEQLDRITSDILEKAEREKLSVLTENKPRYEGMGETSIIRYFYTGPDASKREQDRARRQAVNDAAAKALDAAKSQAEKVFRLTLSRELYRRAWAGMLPQEAVKPLTEQVNVTLAAENVPELQPPMPNEYSLPHHYLVNQFVIRGEDGRYERAHVPRAIADGHFNIETGELSPQTHYEPADIRTAPHWHQEG